MRVAGGAALLFAAWLSLTGLSSAASYAVSELGSFDNREACVAEARRALAAVEGEAGESVRVVEERIVLLGGIGPRALDALVICNPTARGARGFLTVLSDDESAGALRQRIMEAIGE